MDFYNFRVDVYKNCQHTFMFKHVKLNFASDNTDIIISDILQAVMEFSKLRQELERCLCGAGGVSLIRPACNQSLLRF